MMMTHEFQEPRAPARVVILGANGFVPRALRARLERAAGPVTAIGSAELDLTDPAAGARLAGLLRPDDAVVMTSALTPEKGRDLTTLIKNLRMAEQVAAALAMQPCAQLAYISSDAVYDPRDALVNERTPTAPTDLYGLMHLSREMAFTQACAKASVPLCLLRPCAIYGAGDTHNSYGPNRFLRSARTEGKIRLFGRGEETRDHVHIDDVVELIWLVLQHRSRGVLNLTSGAGATFAEVARQVAALAGPAVAVELLPRSGPITHRSFDAAELRRAFPRHAPTGLAPGLARTWGQLPAAS